jgi:hypothetical protein
LRLKIFQCEHRLLIWLVPHFPNMYHTLQLFNIVYSVAVIKSVEATSSSSSSLPSSYICHEVRPLVDPFRSHVSRSIFKGLPWFLLPVGE